MRHKFMYEWGKEFDTKKPEIRVVHETDSVTLSEVVEAFENYLRGCGFIFDGHLDIVEDDIVDEFLEENAGLMDDLAKED